jgi:Tol biopolymer transport system component
VQARCGRPVPTTHPLALITLAGSSDAGLADVSDPAHPSLLCTITGRAFNLHFVSGTVISYVVTTPTGPGSLNTIDLVSDSGGTVASWTGGTFGTGPYAFAPDGRTLAYLAATSASAELHLVANENDRTIATLPLISGRGVSPDDDALTLQFSPDGGYLALVQTYTGAGTSAGDRPFQIRRLDGSLVDSAGPGRTMAAWAGRGSALYFRDTTGIERWTSGASVSTVRTGLKWIRPTASPDGRWMAFMQRDESGLAHVAILDLVNGGALRQLAGGADDPVFLTATTLWYREHRTCQPADACEMGSQSVPTGATDTYDLTTGRSSPTTITDLIDTWSPAR